MLPHSQESQCMMCFTYYEHGPVFSPFCGECRWKRAFPLKNEIKEFTWIPPCDMEPEAKEDYEYWTMIQNQ